MPSRRSRNLLCHNCSTCKLDNHLCHPSSSEGCFENVITGHLFDLSKKHSVPLDLWICIPKCKLRYENYLQQECFLTGRDKGQPIEKCQTQMTSWRSLRFSDERLYIKIKYCYYLGREKCMHFSVSIQEPKYSGALCSPLIFRCI